METDLQIGRIEIEPLNIDTKKEKQHPAEQHDLFPFFFAIIFITYLYWICDFSIKLH